IYKSKIVILSFFIILSVFILAIIISTRNNARQDLDFHSEINLFVEKKKSIRGFRELNDSIAISEMTPRLINPDSTTLLGNPNYMPFFKNLSGKYRIIKASNTDTIQVLRKSDTMYFKLLE